MNSWDWANKGGGYLELGILKKLSIFGAGEYKPKGDKNGSSESRKSSDFGVVGSS